MSSRAQHLRGILITGLGVLILTPDSLIIRLIQTDAWTLLCGRGFLQGLALVLFFMLRDGRRWTATMRSIGGIGLFIAFLYAVSNICFVNAIERTTVANTLVILSSAPLFAAVLSWLFLRERVRLRTWVAAVLGMAGITVIFAGSVGEGGGAGNLCALGAALTLAGSFVVIRHARKLNMVPALALSGFLVAAVCAPWSAPASVSGRDVLWLLLIGAVILPVSFGLITLGPRTVPAPEVNLLMLLETVLGPIWVWAVLGEVPGRSTLLGGLLLVGTVMVHSALALREPQEAGPRLSEG